MRFGRQRSPLRPGGTTTGPTGEHAPFGMSPSRFRARRTTRRQRRTGCSKRPTPWVLADPFAGHQSCLRVALAKNVARGRSRHRPRYRHTDYDKTGCPKIPSFRASHRITRPGAEVEAKHRIRLFSLPPYPTGVPAIPGVRCVSTTVTALTAIPRPPGTANHGDT